MLTVHSSSGIQILPAILPEVSKVTTFIREPTWIAVAGIAGFESREFTPEEKKKFQEDPNALLSFRRWLEHNANRTFPLFVDKSPAQEMARQLFISSMKEKLQDPYLEEKIIPEWAVGCRRSVFLSTSPTDNNNTKPIG